MRLLVETIKDVKLTKGDIEYFNEVMSNGTKFKEWTKDSSPDFTMLAKCMKYELSRGRVRSDIFRHIVQKYNSLFMDMNRATAFAMLNKKVA
jgi:hypothetical protein